MCCIVRRSGYDPNDTIKDTNYQTPCRIRDAKLKSIRLGNGDILLPAVHVGPVRIGNEDQLGLFYNASIKKDSPLCTYRGTLSTSGYDIKSRYVYQIKDGSHTDAA